MQKNNLQEWKDRVRYGQRWIVEPVFSSVKRCLENICINCYNCPNIVKEKR